MAASNNCMIEHQTFESSLGDNSAQEARKCCQSSRWYNISNGHHDKPSVAESLVLIPKVLLLDNHRRILIPFDVG
jgi:ABC-type Na+ transport system ATPase subunit NatA